MKKGILTCVFAITVSTVTTLNAQEKIVNAAKADAKEVVTTTNNNEVKPIKSGPLGSPKPTIINNTGIKPPVVAPSKQPQVIPVVMEVKTTTNDGAKNADPKQKDYKEKSNSELKGDNRYNTNGNKNGKGKVKEKVKKEKEEEKHDDKKNHDKKSD